jgi:membrane-associated phospholipid phosphatase
MAPLIVWIDSLGMYISNFLHQGDIGSLSFFYFFIWNALFHPIVVTLILLIVWYRAHVFHKDRLFAIYMLVFAGAGAIVSLLKAQFERGRPFAFGDEQMLYAVFGSSFPSGHALLSMVIIGMCALYIRDSHREIYV